MSLFKLGTFSLHSGRSSQWKIDCDALTDDDINALAFIASSKLRAFNSVLGIPRGGIRLATAMIKYACEDNPPWAPTLVVDDVLTTGRSMEAYKEKLNGSNLGVIGLVIFARGPCQSWITPLFTAT